MYVCILIYEYMDTDAQCCVYSAHTYAKYHKTSLIKYMKIYDGWD